MQGNDNGFMVYFNFVRNSLKTERFGLYYDFVDYCIDHRRTSKTQRQKNYYRLLRLIALRFFNEDGTQRPMNIWCWKSVCKAYQRYLNS